MGAVCADLHRDHGVDVRLGVGVDGIDGTGDASSGSASPTARCSTPTSWWWASGSSPNTAWLEGSGLTLDDGVVCDATCLAAPGVVAAGDVARWPNRRFDEVMRVEHWDNAIEQGGPRRPPASSPTTGRRALRPGAVVLVRPVRPQDPAGRSLRPRRRVEVVSGSVEERRFVRLLRAGERVVGVLGMNRPRHVGTIAVPDDRITVTCSATVAGAPVEVVVEVLDDGEVTVRLVEPLFDVAAAADQLAARFTTDLGVETTVSCEPPAVRVAVAGTTVPCSAVDPGGVARDFVVEVLDEDGAWSVAIAP
jgi:hypothetical protein